MFSNIPIKIWEIPKTVNFILLWHEIHGTNNEKNVTTKN